RCGGVMLPRPLLLLPEALLEGRRALTTLRAGAPRARPGLADSRLPVSIRPLLPAAPLRAPPRAPAPLHHHTVNHAAGTRIHSFLMAFTPVLLRIKPRRRMYRTIQTYLKRPSFFGLPARPV